MLIPDNLIIEISLPFLVGQFVVYQILFDRLFLKRFRLFNDAVREYILTDTSKLIKELEKLKNKKI